MSDYRVELPGGGGGITLQSAEERDRWQTLENAYRDQYDLRKINDLTNLTTLLVQQINLYRSQQALAGRVPEIDEEGLPTGAYVMRRLAASELKAYQEQVTTASREIREIERTMGIDRKAQPLDAKVLTPGGWRTMADVAPGDLVIGSDGCATLVLGTHSYPEGDVWCVRFTDGSSVKCDRDHLWRVACEWHRPDQARLMTVDEIRSTLRKGKHSGGTLNPWRAPRAPCVHFCDGGLLPIHPYVLGALLGDGGLSRPSTVNFHSMDGAVWAAINERLPDALVLAGRPGYGRISKRSCVGGRWMPNEVLDALRELGLHGVDSHGKFIPRAYLLASPADRLELLAGLVDTDGHVSKRIGGVAYVTVSQRLADDIQFLVRSLGLRCGRSVIPQERPSTFVRTSDALNLTFRVPEGLPIREPSRIANVRKSRYNRDRLSIVGVDHVGPAPVKCITVAADDGLYVTDDFVLTHNSRDQAGDESMKSWLLAMKARAHRYGLHVSARTKAYEELAMELRWRCRLNERGDAEDKNYEDCSAEGIVKWAREQLAELEAKDQEFAQEQGALVLGIGR
jgi:LAGLIDADG-like domain